MTSRIVVLLSAVFITFACSGRAAGRQPTSPGWASSRTRPVPCPSPRGSWRARPSGAATSRSREFHSEPGGRTVRLAVAVFSALGEDKAPDPLVVAPPGPGSSAILTVGPEVASGVGKPLRAQRDVVLVENRGLVLSEPSLMCDEKVEAAFAALEADPSAGESIEDRADRR